MKKENIIKTALEIVPLAVQLLDPEIITNPSSVIAKTGQAITTYFLTKFSSEYKSKVDSHELKNSDFATEKPLLILTDLLRIIDEGKIDQERFKAMKSIFYFATQKKADQSQEEIAYSLFQTAKQLSSEEFLILSANYAVVKNTGRLLSKGVEWGSNRVVNYWAKIISEKIGHNLPELILQSENHLVNLQLISPRQFVQNNMELPVHFNSTPYFRLTALGYKLCEFMTKYE